METRGKLLLVGTGNGISLRDAGMRMRSDKRGGKSAFLEGGGSRKPGAIGTFPLAIQEDEKFSSFTYHWTEFGSRRESFFPS
jgi:hypothetical protein